MPSSWKRKGWGGMAAVRPALPVGPRNVGAAPSVRPSAAVGAAAYPVRPTTAASSGWATGVASGGYGAKRKLPSTAAVPTQKRQTPWAPDPVAASAVAAAAARVRAARGLQPATAALPQAPPPASAKVLKRQRAKFNKDAQAQAQAQAAAAAEPTKSKWASAASKWAKKSKWTKKSKWGQGGGTGSAAASTQSSGEKRATMELNMKLKSGDIPGLIAAAKRCVAAGANACQAASQAMPRILEAAARKAGPAQYSEVLALCPELQLWLDPTTFTKLVVILTSRIPVPTGMVRLTLNLALPADGQAVPLLPPDATEEDERAVFEDGEPLALAGARARQPAPPPGLPAKELGPQPQVRDEQEAQEARATMAKVQPESLRGCVDARDAAMGAYFGHFAALLHLETLVELRALKRRLQRPTLELERFGWMVQGLQVRSAETRSIGKNKGGGLPGRDAGTKRSRVVFAFPRGADISRLRLRSGDSVLLSREDPMVDLVGEGIVAEAPNAENDGAGPSNSGMQGWEERIVVTFDAAFDENAAKRGTWRLDTAANRTAYERQMMALLKMATAKDDKRLALWDILPWTGVGGSNVDAWASKMKEMLDAKQKASLEGADAGSGLGWQGAGQPAAAARAGPAERRLQQLAAEEPAPPAPRALQQVRSRLLHCGITELNPSQCQAVSAAMGRRLTLVQGPPGTGKTTVSVHLLAAWARELRVRPVLATSDSNIAVDNIAEGVQALGLKVVRVGRPEKVTSHLEDITLEAKLRQRQDEKLLREDGEAASGAGLGGKGSTKGLGKGASQAGSWADKAEAKQRRVDEFEAKMAILREADVICTTTIAAGSDFLHLLKFQAILIDEVAQATELSAIVPVALRGAERLVLVGDHCQLPPSICSLEAETRGLSLSVFGRLAAQGLDPYFLDTQFRMHPMIAEFSAQEFYHGRLQTGIDPALRPPPLGFDWPQPGSGIAFVHLDSPERRDGESRINLAEASAVADILAQVLASGELSVLEVGVVSPYSAQVRAMRQLLRRELPVRLQGTGVDLTGGLEGKRGLRALEIASVDAFQGREKELIIFSAVRSNPHGNVGFLADWRRLNVMITRARRGLVVVGNTTTLRGDPTWARWLEWAEASGLVLGGLPGPGPPTWRPQAAGPSATLAQAFVPRWPTAASPMQQAAAFPGGLVGGFDPTGSQAWYGSTLPGAAAASANELDAAEAEAEMCEPLAQTSDADIEGPPSSSDSWF